jgi:hypothetical protein
LLTGFLLELNTVIGAIGVTVQEATIQGDEEFQTEANAFTKGHDFKKNGRLFKFLLSRGGTKLVSIGAAYAAHLSLLPREFELLNCE